MSHFVIVIFDDPVLYMLFAILHVHHFNNFKNNFPSASGSRVLQMLDVRHVCWNYIARQPTHRITSNDIGSIQHLYNFKKVD